MSSLNNIINLMNTDKMTVKTVDKTELTYSNNIIDDLRDINKCK